MQWKNSGLPINKNVKAVPLAGNVVFILEGALNVCSLSIFKSLLKPSVPHRIAQFCGQIGDQFTEIDPFYWEEGYGSWKTKQDALQRVQPKSQCWNSNENFLITLHTARTSTRAIFTSEVDWKNILV